MSTPKHLSPGPSYYFTPLVTRDSDGALFEVLGLGRELHDGRGDMVCLSKPDALGYSRVHQATLAQDFTAYPAPAALDASAPSSSEDTPAKPFTVIAEHHEAAAQFTVGWSWSCANRKCGTVSNGHASHADAFKDPARLAHTCATSDTPAAHTHTDACMCVMAPMDVEGAYECHHCGGHDGGPCGSLCEVAYDEITGGTPLSEVLPDATGGES